MDAKFEILYTILKDLQDAGVVSQRRRKPEKRHKDIETARGMFQFFKGKDHHIKRLHQLINDMPKGWQKKIADALKATGIMLPQ